MVFEIHRKMLGVWVAAFAAVVWLTGPVLVLAQPKEPAARLYVDEDYLYRLSPPLGWHRYDPAGISVPGEICRVWTYDGKTTIVAFIQKPQAAMHPRFLLDTSTAGVKQGNKVVVKEQEVRTVAGMQAMWLVFEGDGTGSALTSNGPVKTYQHWVAVPRESDILVLLLTSPAADFATVEPDFKAMLTTLRVDGRQTPEQRQPEPNPLAAAPINLDFEDSSEAYLLSRGWDPSSTAPASGGLGYKVVIDREVAHGGKASARIGLMEDEVYNFGTLTQAISAEVYRGKRVRLSGWLRTQQVTSGWAGLWLRIGPAEGGELAFDNMEGRGVKGTTDWGRYEVVLDVPEQAAKIVFGALLTEEGTTWVDDLKLEVVGKDVPTTN